MDDIFLLLVLLAVASMAIAGMSFAPWVPSRHKDMGRIFKLAALRAGEVFYDLGCGNGRIIFYAARNSPAQAIGLELSLPLFLICKIRRLLNGRKNTHFKLKNLFKEDLSRADVVYFFGMPKAIKSKLKDKLERELKKGARVISYAFAVPGWTPAIIDKPSKNDVAIYYYLR